MRHDVQGKFTPDCRQTATAETIQALLAAQAAEHWFDDRLALAKNAACLAMSHHETKRFPLLILGIALDAPPLSCLGTLRTQRAVSAT